MRRTILVGATMLTLALVAPATASAGGCRQVVRLPGDQASALLTGPGLSLASPPPAAGYPSPRSARLMTPLATSKTACGPCSIQRWENRSITLLRNEVRKRHSRRG
jgi:hypothetical protein